MMGSSKENLMDPPSGIEKVVTSMAVKMSILGKHMEIS